MSNTENTPRLSPTQQFELAKLSLELKSYSREALEEAVKKLTTMCYSSLNENKLLMAKIMDMSHPDSSFSFEQNMRNTLGLD